MQPIWTKMVAIVSLVGLGCSGQMVLGSPPQGDDDDTASTARELFDDLNQQQVAECGACHLGPNPADTETGPDFLGASADASYDAIRAYRSYLDGGPIVGVSPENSKLYVYGIHTGPALSGGLAAKVAGWISAQAAEDGATPGEVPSPAEPTSLVEALTRFADCMSYTDFQTTQFATVPAQSTAMGVCHGCHAQGTGGAYLNRDPAAFYENQRTLPYILRFATGTVGQDGTFADLVPSGRYETKQADNGHPNYLMDPTRLQAIQSFFDLTYARYRTAIDTATPCARDAPVP